ncbi:hypothetical protein LJC46_08790, partial [Desulfovibrio sp. OttesenSCG-928-G15]|nr:hypothetical protein [Desulfovibrio sp. OttesenSCG-928-G15]
MFAMYFPVFNAPCFVIAQNFGVMQYGNCRQENRSAALAAAPVYSVLKGTFRLLVCCLNYIC